MPTVINLDALVSETALIIVVKGKEHPMANPTVGGMLINMKEVEDLGLNPSMSKELETGMRMVIMAFPSLTEQDIKDWSLAQMNHVIQMARGAAGEIATTDEAEAKSGNAQKAS